MNTRIWRYVLVDSYENTFAIPLPAAVLVVHVQNNKPVLYVEVNPDSQYVERTFITVPTGVDFKKTGTTYVGSFELDDNGRPYVGHVFQKEMIVSP